MSKLINSVNTQTSIVEKKSIGIEVLINNDKNVSQPIHQRKNDSAHLPITNVAAVETYNNGPNLYNNKRKYEFKSPNSTDICLNTNKNNTSKPNEANELCNHDNPNETNENILCFDHSNNSTPKKRRLLIGKNVNKVPELSISTIERHLEMLTSNSDLDENQATNAINLTSNNNLLNNNNNNSIIIVENVNTNEENLVGNACYFGFN